MTLSSMSDFLPFEEFRLEISFRILLASGARGGKKPVAKRLRFADEASCASVSLAEVITFHSSNREIAREAIAEAIAIYALRFIPILAEYVDRIADAKGADHRREICKDVAALIGNGFPFEENADGRLTAMSQDEGDKGGLRCSDEEAVAGLVQCGCDASKPHRQAATGFALCYFAALEDGNLALVVDQHGMTPILAALRDTSGASEVQLAAIDFLERAVGPGSGHVGVVRDTIATFAASSDLILTVTEFIQNETCRDKAIGIISGLVKADPSLRAKVTEADCMSSLLHAMTSAMSDAKSMGQIIDVLGVLLDAHSGSRISEAALQIMQAFPTNLKIQMSSLGVLHSSLQFVAPKTLQTAGAAECVACCMKLCKVIANVQKTGCIILRTIAEDFASGLAGPVAAEVCTVMAAAAQKHAKAPGLMSDVIAVLSALEASEEPQLRAAVKGCFRTIAEVVEARAVADQASDDDRDHAALVASLQLRLETSKT